MNGAPPLKVAMKVISSVADDVIVILRTVVEQGVAAGVPGVPAQGQEVVAACQVADVECAVERAQHLLLQRRCARDGGRDWFQCIV
jgi:hypothetical protein